MMPPLLRQRPLLLALLLLCCTAVSARAQSCAGRPLSRAELGRALRRGAWTGVLDDSATVRRVGCLSGARRGEVLSFYDYERVWGSGRQSTRLIAISNLRGYLGMYAVSDPPSSIRGNRIVFPYPAEHGNVIALRAGTLPRQVLIDGEPLTLFR
jgi:hypothetical protein